MKLTHKLTLAFLFVSLIVIGLAAAFIWGSVYYSFNQYLESQRQNQFAIAAKNYYQTNQTWNGVDKYLREQNLLPPQSDVNAPPQPFVLADVNGRVIVPSAPYRVGDTVARDVLEKGTRIENNGEFYGTVISTGKPLAHNPVDQKYVDQINQALWVAAAGGILISLVLGIFIARSLARPVREITDATRAMAQGKLEQRVPVRSQDELGELAGAFNQMSADLVKSNQARKQMTADIAHDLRNPLTVIGGYLEALKDGKLKPTLERFETMQAEVKRLQRLVDDLRTLSLADAGELKLHLEPVAPREVLERVVAAYHVQAEQKAVTLILDAEECLPEINIDSARMEQALGNLVSNALRYTPAGGKISLMADLLDGRTRIRVSDTGSGIAPEVLPRIFERSYRGDESRSGNESGLGLAIVKSIVELHGGKILAESGKVGAEFSIIL